MQADAFGPFFRSEVTAGGIGDHRVQFRERISLRGDAAAAQRVPARDVTAGFRARLGLKDDFNNRAHAGKLSAMRLGVNAATVQNGTSLRLPPATCHEARPSPYAACPAEARRRT